MPRIDPPMIRPRIKGEMIIGGPSGSPIRLPVGSENQVLTAVEGSPTWTTTAPTYTQAEVDAMVSILNDTGAEGQVIRVVDGSAKWDDEIDSYTKSEVDAFTAPIRVPGSDGQILGTVGGAIAWVDSTDSYTKSEIDDALQMYAESQHAHAISDVAGLELELGDRSLTGHTHTATEITGIEDYVDNVVIDSVAAGLEPAVEAAVSDGIADIDPADIGAADIDHTHDISDLNVSGVADSTTYLRGDGSWAMVEGGVTSVNNQTGAVVLDAADVGAAAAGHTHTPAEIGAAEATHTHGLVELGAAEAVHTHAMGDVTGLGAALNSKSDSTHTHTASDVGAAEAVHTHAMGDVTGLGDALDSKSDSAHTHTVSDVSFPTSGALFVDSSVFAGVEKGSSRVNLGNNSVTLGPLTNSLVVGVGNASVQSNLSIGEAAPTVASHATRKDYVDGRIENHDHKGTYLQGDVVLSANPERINLTNWNLTDGRKLATIPVAGKGGELGSEDKVARSDHNHDSRYASTDGIKSGISTGLSNSTTSYLDIPGLSFDIAAGETWTAEFYLQMQGSSGGMKFELVAPISSTARAYIVGSGGSATSFIYGATATRGGRFPSTGVNAYSGGGWARVSVVVTAAASYPGTVGLRMGAATSGQSNQVYAISSYFNARRVE